MTGGGAKAGQQEERVGFDDVCRWFVVKSSPRPLGAQDRAQAKAAPSASYVLFLVGIRF